MDKAYKNLDNRLQEISNYTRNETSRIINMDKFETLAVDEAYDKSSFLVHFIALGRYREIEFAAITEGIGKPIYYYGFGKIGMIELTDLKEYIDNAINDANYRPG